MGNTPNYLGPNDLLQMLRNNPRRWVVPAIAITLLAAIYAVVRPNKWEASQALIIREEATVDDNRLGGFTDISEMKTAQETILELSRSKSVLRAALVKVGPPAEYKQPELWPTERDVANLRQTIKMTPPGGAEFGKTEVFYLKVRDRDRERAKVLVDEVCHQLEVRFQALRDAKFESIIDELVRSEELAEQDLETATDRLARLEAAVGADLGELRAMHASSSAYSDLRQKLVEVQNEIRGYETAMRRDQQLLEVLKTAKNDPGRLLASPNTLLEVQPALRRLKEGLLDAQLETARLQGKMADEHPQVLAAKAAEQEISRHLHDELAISIRGIEVNLRLTADRLESLKTQLEQGQSRLERLAGLRAQYGNLVATAQNRNQLLERARSNLAEARANHASARSVSLISRIDAPEVGIDPLGPRKASIGLIGLIGGLATGFGVVFLTNPPAPMVPTTPTPASGAGQVSRKPASPASYDLTDGLSFKRALRKLDGLTAALSHE